MIDLDTLRALRRDVKALAEEHPELCEEHARERCARWLVGEALDHAEGDGEPPLGEHDSRPD